MPYFLTPVEDWKNRDYIKMSANQFLGHYELKQHQPWFDDERTKFVDSREVS
jgi:hypothetical protein